ncbi:sensor histidine kinase [Plantactinospora sonchi]|uniref:histidine kinase n=1 Tax=Plantactinospora sonchi TaxID=1544735 RepID=A0ABU7RND1_9ACTN
MRFRNVSLRGKVRVLMASLVALWLFGAWVTVASAANLFFVNTLNTTVFVPSEPLLLALQAERRQTAVYLGAPSDARRTVLEEHRAETRLRASAFTASADGWLAQLSADSRNEEAITFLGAKLGELDATRAAVDAGRIDRATASATFTAVIDAIFGVYYTTASVDDLDIAFRAVDLIALNRSWELMSREDALLAGAIAANQLTAAEQAEFTQLVAARRWQASEATSRLPADDQARYEQMTAGDALRRLGAVEAQVSGAKPGAAPPVTAEQWQSVTQPAMDELHDVVLAGGVAVVEDATPIAVGIALRVLFATGFGLFVVIVSLLWSRTLVRQLEQLRRSAQRLAEERLPGVVARVSRGESVDVAGEAPRLTFTEPEIGQVGHAFNAVHETALRTAAEQAELRRNMREMFLTVAQRTQALLHRLTSLLTEMQHSEEDPKRLAGLYKADHHAIRIRRYTENLAVLAGARSGRAWTKPQPMIDVARAAQQEVDDYERVEVRPFGRVSLVGRAVSSVVHLLAELIENALRSSPPTSKVDIKGGMVANGYAIEIEDRGLGMDEESLTAANELVAGRREFQPGKNVRLGLYVVGWLARQYQIRVVLKESAYGGVTAVVLIPPALVVEPAEPGRTDSVSQPDRSPATRAKAAVTSSALTATAARAPLAVPAQSGRSAGETSELTPAGLPVRRRQASLPEQLRGTESPAEETEVVAPVDPERTRQRFSRYQELSRQGRDDAAEL